MMSTRNRPETRDRRLETGDHDRKSLMSHVSCLMSQRGFTLVELLVVIAILSILMGLVTAGAQTARRRGAVTKAKATIAALETAIAMYQGDMGDYPESENANLVSALSEEPDDPDWMGPRAPAGSVPGCPGRSTRSRVRWRAANSSSVG